MTPEPHPENDTGRSYWERIAPRYDWSMRLLGRPFPRMLALVEKELHGDDAVLEIGAGTGLVTASIARTARRVMATDYAPAMIERVRERARREGLGNVECQVRDLYALDFEPGSFDAVVCANVLHLVPQLDGALRAMAEMLRPGGKLIAPTFVHSETVVSRALSRVLAVTGFPSRRRFTSDALRGAIASAGFDVHALETIPGLIPIAFVAGRTSSGST